MGSVLLSFEHRLTDFRPTRKVRYRGSLFTFHADSSDTLGRFALLEFKGRPGTEPPLHLHRNEDELIHVLDGELKVLRGTEEISVGPGASVFLPRQVPHTFKIVSPSVRAFVYITPGGFEDYFRDLGEPVDGDHPSARREPVSVAEMIRVAARYAVTFMP